jgi:small subunit ribosomal protein S1
MKKQIFSLLFACGIAVGKKILAIDVEKERISLGVKQLENDPNAGDMDGIEKGQTITCTVTEVRDDGIMVKVNDNVTSFVKKNELARERQEQHADRFAVGDRVDARVVSVEKATRKVTVSIKALEVEEHKKAITEYGSVDSGASLGDILGAALSEAAEEGKSKKKKS